jgi:hypothetical protein
MKPRTITWLALLALSFQIDGCAAIQGHWPLRNSLPAPTEGTRLPPVTAPAPPPQAPPNPTVTKPKRRKRHKKVGTNPSGAANQPPVEPNAPVEAETPTPAATPAESSTVTMEGKDAGRAQAQTLLDGANSRLALIDRSKLTGDTSAAFQQASGLAHAARKAMDQGDYLAASGLARKASTLADQVAARISSQ